MDLRLPRKLTGSFVLAALLAGCGSSGPLVAEQLDPVTGVTVTHATAPLVLYRDNSAIAAHARDFVYVGPVEVNRMGSYSYYLWLGIWSTIQDDNDFEQRDGFESVVIFADGEPLRLELKGWSSDSIGVSTSIYPPPTASAANAYYPVTLDQIRLISQARDVRLHTSGNGTATFEPWDNQSSAQSSFRAFMDRLSF